MTEELKPENDAAKWTAFLSYPIWFFALINITGAGRSIPYIKYHALHSIVLNAIVWGISTLVTWTGLLEVVISIFETVGLGAVGPFFPMLILLIPWYYGLLVYRERSFTIPIVTSFIKSRGWV